MVSVVGVGASTLAVLARIDVEEFGLQCLSADLPGRTVDRVPPWKDERQSEPGAAW